GRGLDDVRDVALAGRGIQILELLAGELLVAREVEIGAVMDPLELVPAEGELVLDVVGLFGVVRELLRRMLVEAQLFGSDAQLHQPLHALGAPELEPLAVGAGLYEELHLHLLELARPKREVAGGDLVAERLADLRDAERELLPGGLELVEVVDVGP